MLEFLRKRRNQSEIDKILLDYRGQFRGVIDLLELDGFRPRAQDTWRSNAEQLRKFQAGLSTLSGAGPHTHTVDGRPAALATHLLDDNAPLNPSVEYVAHLALAAEGRGLRTGCLWAQSAASDLAPGKPRRLAGERAIRELDLDALIAMLGPDPKRWGFDPLHVEVPRWREIMKGGA